MPLTMAAVIVLTANHYFIDVAAGIVVMLIGLGIAFAGRHMVQRIVSPNSKAAREKGWVSWLYWLCGVPDSVLVGRRSPAQTA
jgi:Na+/proline symporter